MKNRILSLLLISASFAVSAQTGKMWKKTASIDKNAQVDETKMLLKNPRLYSVDVEALKATVQNAPKTSDFVTSNIIVSFPDSEGNLRDFRVYEKSNFDPALQAKYPNIRSYVGENLDKSSRIYFSLSPAGISTMELMNSGKTVIIEPYTTDRTVYTVYDRAERREPRDFECKTVDNGVNFGEMTGKSADDGILRTYRLALSCTDEYGNWANGAYFQTGAAGALIAMNNTMTRVNGIYETDFSIHMNLIAEEENIIFHTIPSTDPYSSAGPGVNGANNDGVDPLWTKELQNVLHGTTVDYGIGDAKFDIGHLFGRSGGGGNAGCIGCVCKNTVNTTNPWNSIYKGMGFTSPGTGTPVGDNFDVDYVAHEMGHQFGGNHTFTRSSVVSASNEGTVAQMEPGSGSTIMGYAGITDMDVQPHSDGFFHAVSINQITTYIKSTTGDACSVHSANNDTAPVADAGADYTIPKSTPFMLTGAGSDADGDSLTYIWEEYDNQNSGNTGSAATVAPNATKTTGVDFRSWQPTTSPVRYFPTMASVLAGKLFTVASTNELNTEYLPSVARTLNFRFTVRDNKPGGGANAVDAMVVTVNAATGPFKVTSPNTAVSYAGGSSQTVTWDVASTTGAPINCANVDILISLDGGTTWATLLANTPNDGSETVTLPNPNPTVTNARIMVKANGNIFFDVSDSNFTINYDPLGVSDVQKSQIGVYPNPVKDILNITNLKSQAQYEIHNMNGDLVRKGSTNDGKVMVNNLTKGVYVILLENNEGKFTAKFIKE